MTRSNQFDFVRALMERSNIVVTDERSEDLASLDPEVIEAIDNLLFEEFMLGRLNDAPDDVFAATVH